MYRTRFRHPCLRHGRSDTADSHFRTDTEDSKPSSATLPLANTRSTWCLGVHGEFRAVGQTCAMCVTLSRASRDNLSIVFSSIGITNLTLHHHFDLMSTRDPDTD